MPNQFQDRIAPIENLVVPIDLPTEHQATIAKALDTLAELQERRRTCRADAIAALVKTAAARFAAGEITVDQALAYASLAGADDTKIRKVSEALQLATAHAEDQARLAAAPAVVEAFRLRADELRRRVAALETREEEDAATAGVPFEPSETTKRVRATFHHQLERLRALRDHGELPSKAELRALAD